MKSQATSRFTFGTLYKVGRILAYLLSCTLLLILLNVCSEETDEGFLSFLEMNHHTEWRLANDELNVYIRLQNNENLIIEQWRYKSNSDCYEYNPNIFNPGNYEIIENSKDQLVIDCDAVLGDCQKMTFTTYGKTLKVDIEMSEWENETVYFFQALENPDNFDLCQEEPNEDKPVFFN